jgi:hypothetical protein
MLYSELETIISDTIPADDEPTFLAHIPDFVRMAEELIIRSVQLPVMTKTVRGSCTGGNEYLTLPSDYISPMYVSILYNDTYTPLYQKDSTYLMAAFPSVSVANRDVPQYYSPDDEGKLRLRPVPDTNYTFELEYSHKPTSLVDVDAAVSTWISSNMRAALIYASLMHASLYILEYEAAKAYQAQFEMAAGLTKVEQEGKARTERRRNEYSRPKVLENE